MRAVRLTTLQSVPTLLETDAPEPIPGATEVLVQVYAAGVTPSELLWYPTSHNKDGSERTGAIPGHEFSGVIAALGAAVNGYSIGDEVFGMNDWFADGATAEYCVGDASGISPKPASLTHAEAAAVPIGALTAWQGLERARLQAGQRILVHGGAGAVGVFVIQMARLRGAHIITTVSAPNREFVAGLGAERAIDYAAERFEQQVRDLDVVFDCVGGDTLRRSWSVLKPGGRMVTIASNNEAAEDPRVKDAFFIVEPNGQQLAEIGKLVDQGKLRVFVDAEVPLSEAAAAYTRKVESRRGYGKTVIVMPPIQNRYAERRDR
jgi:NADPH:quinone reductase-like Zn-dependent oxidoreductase